jgi:putative sterol carrier protein
MAQKRPHRQDHSREYFRRILEAAAGNDAARYQRVAAHLRGKTVQVIIEAVDDEQFYLVGGSNGKANIQTRNPGAKTDIHLRLPPGAIRGILEGAETPVEAFFLGHLRAKGHTRDLYALHAFFLGLAEIAAVEPKILDILEAFDAAKQRP